MKPPLMGQTLEWQGVWPHGQPSRLPGPAWRANEAVPVLSSCSNPNAASSHLLHAQLHREWQARPAASSHGILSAFGPYSRPKTVLEAPPCHLSASNLNVRMTRDLPGVMRSISQKLLHAQLTMHDASSSPACFPSRANDVLMIAAAGRAWPGSFAESWESPSLEGCGAESVTLAEGQLNVGHHLPLLAGRFRFVESLSEGGSAKVFTAVDVAHPSQRKVVIKAMHRHYREVGAQEQQMLRFLNARDEHDSCHIVRLLAGFEYRGHTCLVLEHLQGSLLDYINACHAGAIVAEVAASPPPHDVREQGVTAPVGCGGHRSTVLGGVAGREGEEVGAVSSRSAISSVRLNQIRQMALHLVVALSTLHEAGVIHGDLKPENVLLQVAAAGGAAAGQDSSRTASFSKSMSDCSDADAMAAHDKTQALLDGTVGVKLADFGNSFTAEQIKGLCSDFNVQTLAYRAPEVLLGLPFDRSIDLWSLGCIIAELAIGWLLFACETPAQLLQQMTAMLGAPPPAELFGQGKFFSRLVHEGGMLPSACSWGYLQQSGHLLASASALAAAAAAAAGDGGMGMAGGMAAAVRDGAALPMRLSFCSPGRSRLGDLLLRVDAQLADLVGSLLQYDPRLRLTAHEAIFHPFFGPILPFSSLFPSYAPRARHPAITFTPLPLPSSHLIPPSLFGASLLPLPAAQTAHLHAPLLPSLSSLPFPVPHFPSDARVHPLPLSEFQKQKQMKMNAAAWGLSPPAIAPFPAAPSLWPIWTHSLASSHVASTLPAAPSVHAALSFTHAPPPMHVPAAAGPTAAAAAVAFHASRDFFPAAADEDSFCLPPPAMSAAAVAAAAAAASHSLQALHSLPHDFAATSAAAAAAAAAAVSAVAPSGFWPSLAEPRGQSDSLQWQAAAGGGHTGSSSSNGVGSSMGCGNRRGMADTSALAVTALSSCSLPPLSLPPPLPPTPLLVSEEYLALKGKGTAGIYNGGSSRSSSRAADQEKAAAVPSMLLLGAMAVPPHGSEPSALGSLAAEHLSAAPPLHLQTHPLRHPSNSEAAAAAAALWRPMPGADSTATAWHHAVAAAAASAAAAADDGHGSVAAKAPFSAGNRGAGGSAVFGEEIYSNPTTPDSSAAAAAAGGGVSVPGLAFGMMTPPSRVAPWVPATPVRVSEELKRAGGHEDGREGCHPEASFYSGGVAAGSRGAAGLAGFSSVVKDGGGGVAEGFGALYNSEEENGSAAWSEMVTLGVRRNGGSDGNDVGVAGTMDRAPLPGAAFGISGMRAEDFAAAANAKFGGFAWNGHADMGYGACPGALSGSHFMPYQQLPDRANMLKLDSVASLRSGNCGAALGFGGEKGGAYADSEPRMQSLDAALSLYPKSVWGNEKRARFVK